MKKTLLIALAILLFAATAQAIDLHNFQPAIGTQNLMTQYSSSTYAMGQFGIAVSANYAAEPLILSYADDEEFRLIEQMFTYELQAAVGLFDFIDIGFAGNFNQLSGEDLDQKLGLAFPESDSTDFSGMGDIRAALKFRLLENKPGSLGIALIALGEFPTGDPDQYLGAGAANAGGRLAIDKRFDRVNIVLNGGYVYMGDEDGADEGLDPTGRAEFGAGVSVLAAKDFELLAEIFGRTVDYQIEGLDAEVPSEALAAMKYYLDPVCFTVGGSLGINSGIGNPMYRVFAGVALTWPAVQRVAKQAPATIAADSKLADADRDGLTNYDETHIYGTEYTNPDTDGDGLPDGDEIRIHHTDPKRADTDGDGLNDNAEVKLYNTNPLERDTDGDTLSDGQEVNELRTSPLTQDSDGDKVPDNLDGAPLEQETVNGYMDEDGVPEVLLARKPSGLMMFEGQFVLPKPLTFDGPQGSTLNNDDKKMLDDLAQLLQEYPNVKIQIEGHVASDVASAQALSETRARAVRDYLIKKKVAADRMTAVGLGNQVPIAPVNTAEGQARNTRIDLLITEQ